MCLLNKLRVLERAMTYDEFRRQLGKAGLTAREFASLARLNRNSVTNYAKDGEVPTHWALVAVLMGEMAEHGLDFREAMKRVETVPKKVRGSAAKGRFGGSKQSDLFLQATKSEAAQ